MLKIAICDDSKVDVEQLEIVLDTLCHYQIYYDVYFSAEELLECMAMHREEYHLYIFDIEMPHMTGLELAKEIRKIDTNALFVFLTGYDQYVMDVFKGYGKTGRGFIEGHRASRNYQTGFCLSFSQESVQGKL